MIRVSSDFHARLPGKKGFCRSEMSPITSAYIGIASPKGNTGKALFPTRQNTRIWGDEKSFGVRTGKVKKKAQIRTLSNLCRKALS